MKSIVSIALVLCCLFLFATFNSFADNPAIIQIPAIGVDAAVVPVYIESTPYGTTWDVSGLYMNAGLFTGLGTFGQRGNTVIGAHSLASDGSPDLFFHLDTLQAGNQIVVHHNGQQLVYEVTEVFEVDETDVRVIYPTQDERLTLITCARESYNSATGDYSRRVVVVARRVA